MYSVDMPVLFWLWDWQSWCCFVSFCVHDSGDGGAADQGPAADSCAATADRSLLVLIVHPSFHVICMLHHSALHSQPPSGCMHSMPSRVSSLLNCSERWQIKCNSCVPTLYHYAANLAFELQQVCWCLHWLTRTHLQSVLSVKLFWELANEM